MIKIYSNIKKDKLLHVIYRIEDFKEGREEIIPPDQFIQCAALKMDKGKTFKPHKHNFHVVIDYDRVAQESWVVIRGSVRCILYDINDEVIATPILHAGDASFTLRGGHTYDVLEDNTIVYEMKTGKYIDQQHDKTFING